MIDDMDYIGKIPVLMMRMYCAVLVNMFMGMEVFHIVIMTVMFLIEYNIKIPGLYS